MAQSRSSKSNRNRQCMQSPLTCHDSSAFCLGCGTFALPSPPIVFAAVAAMAVAVSIWLTLLSMPCGAHRERRAATKRRMCSTRPMHTHRVACDRNSKQIIPINAVGAQIAKVEWVQVLYTAPNSTCSANEASERFCPELRLPLLGEERGEALAVAAFLLTCGVQINGYPTSDGPAICNPQL